MSIKFSKNGSHGGLDMPSRLSTFALLVSAAGLLALSAVLGGCATSGQDQNYKLLEEDRPMFDTRPDTNKPGEARGPVNASYIATAPEDQPAQAGMDNVTSEPVQAVDTPAAQQGDLKPAAATTPGDTAETDPHTITAVQDALAASPPAGRSINGLDRSHWAKVVVGPDLSAPYQPSYFKEADVHTDVWCLVAFERVCFAAGVVALPVKMIITPPWTRTSSQSAHPSCGDQGECCTDKSASDDNLDDQTTATASHSSTNKSTSKSLGCLSGNHAGCMQCTCTSLKDADEHTCEECCS